MSSLVLLLSSLSCFYICRPETQKVRSAPGHELSYRKSFSCLCVKTVMPLYKINSRPNGLHHVALLMVPNIKPSWMISPSEPAHQNKNTRHVSVFVPKSFLTTGLSTACRRTPKEGFHNRHRYVWLFTTKSVHIWPLKWTGSPETSAI